MERSVMKILAVDPGSHKSGAALMWRAADKETILVEKTFLIKPEKSTLPMLVRTKQICEQLGALCHEHRPDVLVIEYPTIRPGIKHIDTLFFFCGYLTAAVDGWVNEVYLYTVGKSKGNLPKEVVRHRVWDKYGIEGAEDENDAVYLGHRYLTLIAPKE